MDIVTIQYQAGNSPIPGLDCDQFYILVNGKPMFTFYSWKAVLDWIKRTHTDMGCKIVVRG